MAIEDGEPWKTKLSLYCNSATMKTSSEREVVLTLHSPTGGVFGKP